VTKNGHAGLLYSGCNWRTGILRLHSRVRAVPKILRKRFTHSQSIKLLKPWIKKGDLVFDIGANVGDMTALYLELGARVISAEPQEDCLRVLEKRFGQNSRVTIVHKAVADDEGEREIMLSDIRSPLSSMSPQWITAVKSSGRFPYYEWSQPIPVPVTTLDALIAKYGEPDFCKIDVEGFERAVLRGLSRPLGRLSFEFHVEFLSEANACLDLLIALGEYSFNYTIDNQPFFELPSFVDQAEISRRLRSLPFTSLQGDVYARLSPTGSP